MKWLSIIMLVNLFLVQKPNTKQEILNDWISTQNDGSNEAINAFIDTWFSPEMRQNMKNRDQHLAFYRQIIDEFGSVQDHVYEVMESTETKLKVQLIKKGQPLVPEPSPENILVVEIDIQKDKPQFLSRGLGMGALICYIKR